MYPKKAFSTREQDYSALLRQKLEEAEVMLRQLNPSMERGLALTKLDECLLWANVSIAGTGISKDWRPACEKRNGRGCSYTTAPRSQGFDLDDALGDFDGRRVRTASPGDITLDGQKIVAKEPEWSNSHFRPYFDGVMPLHVNVEKALENAKRGAAAGMGTVSQELSRLERAASKEKVDDKGRESKDDGLQAVVAEAVHVGMRCTISSTDGELSKFPALEKAASSWQTLLNYGPNVNDPEEVKAWLGEVVKYKKAAAVVQDFYDTWIEEKQAREAHQNE